MSQVCIFSCVSSLFLQYFFKFWIHRNLPRGPALGLIYMPITAVCLPRNLFALLVPFFTSFWNCVGCTFGRFDGMFGLPFEVIREGATDLAAATGWKGGLPVIIAWLFWAARIGVRLHSCGAGRIGFDMLLCERTDGIDRSELGSNVEKYRFVYFSVCYLIIKYKIENRELLSIEDHQLELTRCAR